MCGGRDLVSQLVATGAVLQVLDESLQRVYSFDVGKLLKSNGGEVQGVTQQVEVIAVTVSHGQLAVSFSTSVLLLSISTPECFSSIPCDAISSQEWAIEVVSELAMPRGQVPLVLYLYSHFW